MKRLKIDDWEMRTVIFHKIYLWIQSHTTKELVNIMLWATLILFLATAFCGYLLGKSSANNFLLNLFGLGLFLLMFSFFLLGAVMFLRKEDPYTISQNWFGIRKFSHGIWPQLQGLFIMAIAGLVIVVLFFMPAVRKFLPRF